MPAASPAGLECVVNVSEGADRSRLSALIEAAGDSLVDLHVDAHHNRSVFTLLGDDLFAATRSLATTAVAILDLTSHRGVHPRLGVLDVVPFVPLGDDGLVVPPRLDAALAARDAFANFLATDLALPCFLYGPERTLPEIRRRAFVALAPDLGPRAPHPTAGACCVGARGALIAYNVVLADADLDLGRTIAATLRRPEVRSLAFDLAGAVQISCNLVAPLVVGPAQVYDEIARLADDAGARIASAELVGLLPARVLDAIAPVRHGTLGLSPDQTIESTLTRLGSAADRDAG
jgi:glutamate formiminotransferase